MKDLIRNAIQTPDGTIIESTHRHDYGTHKDDLTGKTYMVDGGLQYTRSSVHEDQKYLHLYNDEPHEVQAKVLTWGTYGINGDQPLKHVSISEMDTAHIGNVLAIPNISSVHRECMKVELERRSHDNAE